MRLSGLGGGGGTALPRHGARDFSQTLRARQGTLCACTQTQVWIRCGWLDTSNCMRCSACLGESSNRMICFRLPSENAPLPVACPAPLRLRYGTRAATDRSSLTAARASVRRRACLLHNFCGDGEDFTVHARARSVVAALAPARAAHGAIDGRTATATFVECVCDRLRPHAA